MRRITLVVLLVVMSASPGAYVLLGPRWATQQVPYYVNPANSDMPETDASALEGVSGEEAERFRSDAPPGRLILMFFQTDYNTNRLNGLLRWLPRLHCRVG